MPKVIDVRWFNGRSLVGVVKVLDPYDGIKYYIGAVSNSTTEEADAQHIADWGSAFPQPAAEALFGNA